MAHQGVGAGLASFLGRALGERVIPYVFDRRTKSDLGWGFLTVVDTGRFKDYLVDPGDPAQPTGDLQKTTDSAILLPENSFDLEKWDSPTFLIIGPVRSNWT